MIDSIKDVLDWPENMYVFTIDKPDQEFIKEETHKIKYNQILHNIFLDFSDKIHIFNRSYFIELTLTPKLMVEWALKSVVIEDDFSMQWIKVKAQYVIYFNAI
jgi:hypothetical protein